jgi:NifU-like protein
MDSQEAAVPAPADAEADAERWRIASEVVAEMRPIVQADGGDMELVEIRGDRVFVTLTGACVGCGMAGHTLGAVRRHLMQALDAPVRVVPAQA